MSGHFEPNILSEKNLKLEDLFLENHVVDKQKLNDLTKEVSAEFLTAIKNVRKYQNENFGWLFHNDSMVGQALKWTSGALNFISFGFFDWISNGSIPSFNTQYRQIREYEDSVDKKLYGAKRSLNEVINFATNSKYKLRHGQYMNSDRYSNIVQERVEKALKLSENKEFQSLEFEIFNDSDGDGTFFNSSESKYGKPKLVNGPLSLEFIDYPLKPTDGSYRLGWSDEISFKTISEKHKNKTYEMLQKNADKFLDIVKQSSQGLDKYQENASQLSRARSILDFQVKNVDRFLAHQS